MRKPEPIHVICARLKRKSLPDRINELRCLLAKERPFSVRRNELQSLLNGAMTKQIRKELRRAA
jgi:hypothetical protein